MRLMCMCLCNVHAGGNVRLVEAMLTDIPVMYDAVVREVQYGPQGVTVTTQDTSIKGATAATRSCRQCVLMTHASARATGNRHLSENVCVCTCA